MGNACGPNGHKKFMWYNLSNDNVAVCVPHSFLVVWNESLYMKIYCTMHFINYLLSIAPFFTFRYFLL